MTQTTTDHPGRQALTAVSMSLQDSLWLTMDRPNNLMIVDGAMVLLGQPTLDQVRRVFSATVEKFPVFGRKAVRSGQGWAWQDDENFDVADHVTLVNLPGPADLRSLQLLMGVQRSVPLPTDRARWQAFLVPDLTLPDGSEASALVSRFHHAMADGVRLTQVILGMCESDDTAVEAVVSRDQQRTDSASGAESDGGSRLDFMRGSLSGASAAASRVTFAADDVAGGAGSGALLSIRHPRNALASGLRGVRRLPDRLNSAAHVGASGVENGIEGIRHPYHLLDALEYFGVESNRGLSDAASLAKLALGTTPETVWTGKPGRAKVLAWSEPISLADIKSVGKANGVTVNDVLLAAMAGGLRKYLEQRDGLVDEINWMVPVNLKPFADNLPPELGNYFALVFLPMTLGHSDATERLAHLHHAMDRIKHSDEAAMTFGLQRAVSVSPAKIAFFLTNFFASKAVGVLTNVPGPTNELNFAGAPVRQVIGFAPCSGDAPMTATIFNYNGGVTIGFASDAGLVPDPEVLSDLVIGDLTDMIRTLASS